MSSNPFDVLAPKKKKKSSFETTTNPFDQVMEHINTGQPSMEDMFHNVKSTTGEYRGETPTGIDPAMEISKTVEPKRITPMSILSAGLSSSTRFMDSMATDGYSLWDTLTPFTIQKLAENGPVSFIKSIGKGLGSVGSELGGIIGGAYQNVTGQDINQTKQVADFAKISEDEFKALPQPVKNQIVTQYNLETKPQEMTSFDLISKYHPDFVKDYPIAAHVMSFVGDVALDPTTYIGFESSLPRIAGTKVSWEGVNTIKDLNSLAKFGFQAEVEKNGLRQLIDIGPSEIRQIRYIEDTLGTTEAQNALSKYLSSYGDVKNIAPFTGAQRNTSVESTFRRLLVSNPKLGQEEGLGIFARIPIIGEVPIIKSEVVNKFLENTGINKLRNSIAENLSTNTTEAVHHMFQRDYNLSVPYLKERQIFEGQTNLVDHQIIASATELFKFAPDRREGLMLLASEIDSRVLAKQELLNQKYTGMVEELKPNQYGGMYNKAGQATVPIQVNSLEGKIYISAPGLPQQIVNKAEEIIPKLEELGYKRAFPLPTGKVIPPPNISDSVINATRQSSLNEAMRNKRITQAEFTQFSKYIDATNQFAQIEMESKLYKQATQNAEPRNLFFPSNIRKVAFGEGVEESELLAKGFVPENDIAVLHAMRMKSTLYQQASEHFTNAVKMLYTDVSPVTGKEIVKLPKEVKADLQFIGKTYFADNVGDMTKPFWKAIDKLNGLYKFGAYAIRPAQGVKQYIGNTLQQYAKIGASAFKAFDPRNIVETAIIMADKSSFRSIVPQFLLDGVQQYGTPTGKALLAINKMEPKLIDKYAFTSRLGETVTGPQLMDELIKQDIYHKGSELLDTGQVTNLKLEIAKSDGFFGFQKEKWQQGKWTFIKESIPWINIPAHIETMGKVSTYINARKIGHLPEEAKRLVNEALFPYAHGLSEFEQTSMRRLVPFYTFQRFAIPLVASLVKEPGKAMTLNKIAKSFFEVWNDVSSGQKLTEQQREVLPGYILEQPHAFEGMSNDGSTPEKGVFRTFNSFNFTDMLSLVQTKVDGSIDIGPTVQKMSLAQITPLLKIPLELLAHKNFFTDQVIDSSQKDRIAQGSKVQQVTKLMDHINNNVPDSVKHFIGYEERPDMLTREPRAYINPYLTYLANSFVPAVSDYVHITKDDLNAREFAMKYFTGVGTVKVNFEAAKRGKIYEWKKEIDEIQKDLRGKYNNPMLQDVVNADQKKLQDLIKKINDIQNLNVSPTKQ